jgi:hypothetical protein
MMLFFLLPVTNAGSPRRASQADKRSVYAAAERKLSARLKSGCGRKAKAAPR